VPSGVTKMRYAVQFVTGRMEIVRKFQKPGKVADLDAHSVKVPGRKLDSQENRATVSELPLTL
jgi:hypothetical protein